MISTALIEKSYTHALQLFADAEDQGHAKYLGDSRHSTPEHDIGYHSFDASDGFHLPIEAHAELLAA
ncbi:hypothetical protein C5748_22725 [Phyllobacterium phragmitis]|uniref:Uncharacterized protein n=1 Tax=Phyllobacterium phragmitis TaxID=2670329 RepID=A0A2S9IKX1_9HYPH|nr:hypothetical protein [Phyllobacterium phragmitis]PRD41176.1 hypothetical protein C5748_22725 [Phyllobacterium phragmitis]